MEQDFYVKVHPGGRITVPKEIRDALGWGPGDEILWTEHGTAWVLEHVSGRPAHAIAEDDHGAAYNTDLEEGAACDSGRDAPDE